MRRSHLPLLQDRFEREGLDRFEREGMAASVSSIMMNGDVWHHGDLAIVLLGRL